jgi:hypothetical protein
MRRRVLLFFFASRIRGRGGPRRAWRSTCSRTRRFTPRFRSIPPSLISDEFHFETASLVCLENLASWPTVHSSRYSVCYLSHGIWLAWWYGFPVCCGGERVSRLAQWHCTHLKLCTEQTGASLISHLPRKWCQPKMWIPHNF